MFGTKYWIVAVMILFNRVDAHDSVYLRHFKQCLNPLFVEANAQKILPIFAVKDSVEGVCFMSLDVLSDVLDSSSLYAAHFVDSLLQFKLPFNLNEMNCSQKFLQFMTLKEVLDKSDSISDNCLLKGRRKSFFKHVLYIDDRLSDQNKYLWMWNEFMMGNYYQWYACDGLFLKQDYFYRLNAK